MDGEWIAFARIVGLELEERGLPIFGWYTSQGQCLDGKGDSADVVVEPDPYLRNAGVDLQLNKAMEALGRIGIEKAIS